MQLWYSTTVARLVCYCIQEIQKVTRSNQKIQEYDTGPKAIKSVTPPHLVDFAIFNQLPVNCLVYLLVFQVGIFINLNQFLGVDPFASSLCALPFHQQRQCWFCPLSRPHFHFTISIVAASFSSLILLAS